MSELVNSSSCQKTQEVLSSVNQELMNLSREIHVIGSAADLTETIKKIESYRQDLLDDSQSRIGKIGCQAQIGLEDDTAMLICRPEACPYVTTFS